MKRRNNQFLEYVDNDETNSLFAIAIIKAKIKSIKEKGKYLQYFDDFVATY